MLNRFAWTFAAVIVALLGGSASAQDPGEFYCQLKCTEYGLRTGACKCDDTSVPAEQPAPKLPQAQEVAAVVCPAAGNATTTAGECYNKMVGAYNQRLAQFNANVASANSWSASQRTMLRQMCDQMRSMASTNNLQAALPPACAQL